VTSLRLSDEFTFSGWQKQQKPLYPNISHLLSLTIDNMSDTDQRIDKFLKKYLPNAPLGGIYKWLRTGKIKVNHKKVEQTYRIEEGDVIDLHLNEDELWGFRKAVDGQISKSANQQTLRILYEDEYLLILNKPAGINVHPGDHKTKEVSLIELVQDSLWGRYNTLSFKPSLVHRIDRDTSGVIMIAKEKKTLEALLALLQSGRIEKIYHAVIVGIPEKSRDTIDAKLLRVEEAKDEAKVRLDENGQNAITHYRILSANIRDKYSLVECHIETGRTHQIRVHLSSIGHPILWDKAYGNKSENSFAKREYSISRQLLHARSLSFIHPITKQVFTVEAPYPHDIDSLIK
jgi:23S rRNA pseudouridine955/2504/2580 synthase